MLPLNSLRCLSCGSFALFLFLALAPNASGSVKLTAEIESTDWWFRDPIGDSNGSQSSRVWTAQCVVDTNRWSLMGEFLTNARVTWRFVPTNLIEEIEVLRGPTESEAQRMNRPNFIAGTFPEMGARMTNRYPSWDGNPGRPPRTIDLMLVPSARILWLAYCSSICLERKDHHLYPPSDFWKEFFPSPVVFSDRTKRFDDPLGLPTSIDLLTTNMQVAMQYRVLRSTNFLGWNIPTEFCLVQYRPSASNGWEVFLTAKGKLTSIGRDDAPSRSSVHYSSRAGTKLAIEGGNNIHDWLIQSETVNGFLEIDPNLLSDARQSSDPIRAHLEGKVPVQSLHGNEGRPIDALIHRTLKEARNPDIAFRFDGFSKGAFNEENRSLKFEAEGELIAAGITHRIALPISVEYLNKAQLKVHGDTRIKMSQFDIAPPHIRVGDDGQAIRYSDDVHVSLDWALERND